MRLQHLVIIWNTLFKYGFSVFISYFAFENISVDLIVALISCFLMLQTYKCMDSISNLWVFFIFLEDNISMQCVLCSFFLCDNITDVCPRIFDVSPKVCKLQTLWLVTFPGPSFKAGRLIYDGHLLLAIVHQNVGMSWGKLLSGRQSQLICLSIKF